MKKKTLVVLICCIILAGLFSGCQDSKAKKNGYADKIYLYNWSEYMTQDVLDGFKREYGIEVVQSTYESNDEMMAKLIAGKKGQYDIAVPTNYYISSMKEKGLLETYDKNAITNFKNIDPSYKNLQYDPDNQYTVPYMGTVCLWVGNKKLLDKSGITIKKMSDLKNNALKNNIVLTDDPQDDIGIALAGMGKDPVTNDINTIKSTANYWNDMRDYIKSISGASDTRTMLARGEIALANVYSGDALQAMEQNKDLQIVMDDEKKSFSVDNFVLLKGSKHKKEAELFINYCLRPDVSAKLTEEYKFVCLNKAAVSHLPDSLAKNTACVLTDKMKKQLFYINDFDPNSTSAMVDVMTRVKSSR
ncbi:polyamine ABC transporter substrate-binding protein [Clostridium tyrobutyricum]|uniref:polyamine ABC transporter substrate-binding protein n=1 Tax=Clostridium tyrobutyricum TaxID=1519 RepID=UPI0011C93D4A|nr:spermidine/putrescine ABC transporter substrate-binding protein [Clostridium tyrobutyricum]